MDLEQGLQPVLSEFYDSQDSLALSAAPPYCSVQSPVASEGAVDTIKLRDLHLWSRGWEGGNKSILAACREDTANKYIFEVKFFLHFTLRDWNLKPSEPLSHTWMSAKICNSCMGVSEFKVRTLNAVFLPFMGQDLGPFLLIWEELVWLDLTRVE